ncbi:MAG TPA: AMP-binding protein [Gemmatimonadales bacterium]|nr:AMP-binding protein [Gemmatimonadales bacterium]
MSAGRPEIGPALTAAWRHGRPGRTDLRAWQDARLRRLVLHAYESVPFYRRLFDRHRLHPRHVRGVRDLELIPFTDKAEMRRARSADLLARGLDPAALLSVRTSGSSGEPFTVRRTWLEDKLQYLLRLRTFRAFGIRHRDRIVVVGVGGRPESGDRKVVGRSLRALGFHDKRLIDGLQDPARVAVQLREARPEVLVGLPGMLHRLTAPELSSIVTEVRPRVVVVGGEVATPAMRLRIREVFGAPLYETYGSHECPLMAWECRHSGDLHTCDDGVLVEVLRDGQPVEPGERGEVVVTNLHAYAMPFIRYRIGDLATRGGACGCGLPFAAIGEIQGRMLDYFPLPDGRVLHPYEIVRLLVWGPGEWLRQYQLVQERTDRVVLYAVAGEPVAARLEAVTRAVRPLLGPAVEFEIRLVERIPVESTGKLRPSRSLVRSEYDRLRFEPVRPAWFHCRTRGA